MTSAGPTAEGSGYPGRRAPPTRVPYALNIPNIRYSRVPLGPGRHGGLEEGQGGQGPGGPEVAKAHKDYAGITAVSAGSGCFASCGGFGHSGTLWPPLAPFPWTPSKTVPTVFSGGLPLRSVRPYSRARRPYSRAREPYSRAWEPYSRAWGP